MARTITDSVDCGAVANEAHEHTIDANGLRFRAPRIAEDIAALASKLAAEGSMGSAVIGVGRSSGATSLLAAAGMHPERFAALVAIEPVLWGEPASRGTDSFAGSSRACGFSKAPATSRP